MPMKLSATFSGRKNTDGAKPGKPEPLFASETSSFAWPVPWPLRTRSSGSLSSSAKSQPTMSIPLSGATDR